MQPDSNQPARLYGRAENPQIWNFRGHYCSEPEILTYH